MNDIISPKQLKTILINTKNVATRQALADFFDSYNRLCERVARLERKAGLRDD